MALWASAPASLWCPALWRAAPGRQGGRWPFNPRRAVPRRSRESCGGWGAVPRLGACGGWSQRWSRRLWRRESVSVREGRGPDRNRNRGCEAFPFPEGAGTRRPFLTPRPRPGRGGAPNPPLRRWRGETPPTMRPAGAVTLAGSELRREPPGPGDSPSPNGPRLLLRRVAPPRLPWPEEGPSELHLPGLRLITGSDGPLCPRAPNLSFLAAAQRDSLLSDP